ncbi:hypothetical protein TBLA_0B08060 [Henningerozyma blattae CBS 6284]|uniref:KaiC-like domain-containing protein n=1 Tax=Henningerozyma blattae (strain ATCC 34711 / CBS 6284 / DSM 70876 / NBRC 10599 / NRRL Y-10934 / UCD 77-7) TaxID=1071380 RepID=I2GZS0_HENB6|nr:hypothetical protein TBLA_0B08060 [Tetrapisispora blattae CBS 6284]CCH59622.1 hypothetical protein TBLA_0B08060 [Tetrapisispora blattae CBS 6284]
MSFGVSLSQLITNNKPISTGIPILDEQLDSGFQQRSIYEIYGPPGVGKRLLGQQIIENANDGDRILWIDTYNTIDFKHSNGKNRQNNNLKIQEKHIDFIRIDKASQLIYFFQKLAIKYTIIIIDRFSQIITDYLYTLYSKEKSFEVKNIHEIKCNYLCVIFTLFTKYNNKNDSTIILLDDCMNTGYTPMDLHGSNSNYEVIGNNNFLVQKNHYDNLVMNPDEMNDNSNKPANVQVLRSGLVGNIGYGPKDYKWLVFLKNQIGMFRDWNDGGQTENNSDLCRILLINGTDKSNSNSIHGQSPNSRPSSRDKNYHSRKENVMDNKVVIVINPNTGRFEDKIHMKQVTKRTNNEDSSDETVNEEKLEGVKRVKTNSSSVDIANLDIVSDNNDIVYDSEG